jgi:dihydrodipicolinate synthase/N-acetylneuraminate lyase
LLNKGDLIVLTRETLTGPWAGPPVAWTEQDEFDEATYRKDVARCCEAGVPGVYTGGTTGEFYAMEFEEFKAVTRATVEECKVHGVPVMIGCTSTYTLGAARRAAFAAECGADVIQLTLPYWIEMEGSQIVPFFKEVVAAAGGLPMSIYELLRMKRILTLDEHRAMKDAVPNYLMVKATRGTLGATQAGCEALSAFVNVFAGEHQWAELGPYGASGSCSSVVYWNPRFTLDLWEHVEKQEWSRVQAGCQRIQDCFDFQDTAFEGRGFTATAVDRLGGVASGFLKTSLRSRGPYPSINEDDVRIMRDWYRLQFPQMLEN